MDNVLGLAFVTLGGLFTFWNGLGLWHYGKYRRLASTAELTWTPQRPWFYGMCLGIGFFMVSLTMLSVFVLRPSPPLLSTVAQGLMALYYTVVFPLTLTIQRGFYRSGIWLERSFVPYESIERLSWRETSDIVLLVESDHGLLGQGYRRLKVPGERFGEARRILASHIEDQTLSVETHILGLSDVDRPAQEQV